MQDEEIPDAETKIDVAYSLRASTYRGQKQLTLQFQELRVNEERPIEIRKPKIDLRDLRLQPSTFELHASNFNLGRRKDKAKGKSRFDLYPADEFTIYHNSPIDQ